MRRLNIKNEKGVTLIALITTIIVLMILAGITFTALTNEKNVIKEAKDAKTSAEQESAKERVQAAVLGSVKKNGEIDTTILNSKLSTSISSFPATITVDGVEIVIEADGTVHLASDNT